MKKKYQEYKRPDDGTWKWKETKERQTEPQTQQTNIVILKWNKIKSKERPRTKNHLKKDCLKARRPPTPPINPTTPTPKTIYIMLLQGKKERKKEQCL